MLLVAAVFLPVWGFEFILGDDYVHLHSNPGLQLPFWQQLAAYFTQGYKKVYMPVTYAGYGAGKGRGFAANEAEDELEAKEQ